MTGTMIGVGLGPGAPDLVTVKAARLIENARVIAYPAPEGGESFARKIAKPYIPENAIEIPILVPMQEERFPAQEIYRQASTKIAKHLNEGTDVIVLCQGDPFFYGSFMYLFITLENSHPIEVVPGVSSLAGCAAAAKQPLCARMEPLLILPAPISEDQLRSQLSEKDRGGVVIVKIGRHFKKLKKVLHSLGLIKNAVFVAHASLPQENILPIVEVSDEQEVPYFSTILIPGRDPYGTR